MLNVVTNKLYMEDDPEVFLELFSGGGLLWQQSYCLFQQGRRIKR